MLLTVAARVQVYGAANADVDDTEEALILLLELLLVKYLDRKNAVFGSSPAPCQRRLLEPGCRARSGRISYMSKLSFQYGFSVFLMTLVVRVCSPFMVATAKGSGNPGVGSVSGRQTEGATAY